MDVSYFFYYFRCPQCKKAFAVGQTVKMIPLTKEQEDSVLAQGPRDLFKTADPEPENAE
jgi:hypothetical protein